MSRFEPKVVAFLCNFCSYAGADSCGAQHREVPANVRVVRVMCTGRVDPQFVLEAFRSGADGVMVLGCHPGDCHYKTGNYNAVRRMTALHALLAQFGVGRDRFVMDFVSAAEAEKFSTLTGSFVERVRELGPLALTGGEVAAHA